MDILHKRNLRRAKKVYNFYKEYLKKEKMGLDIGLGNGYIAREIQENSGINMTGVDIIDYNKTKVKNILFDGKILPFKDKEFDIAFITEVLHHCDDPGAIIDEAKRVSSKIVILEDIYVNRVHLYIMKAYDFIMNVRHGVNTPFNFHKHEDWLKIFSKKSMKVIATKEYRFNPFYSPMKTQFYYLDV